MPFFEKADDGSWVPTHQVEVRHLVPGGSWFKKVRFEILRSLKYCPSDDDGDDCVIVGKGETTDLASVPAFLWGVVARYGQHTLPAIVHDHLYKKAAADKTTGRTGRMQARELADELFRRAMSETEVPWAKRWVIWSAVRFGGVLAEYGLVSVLWIILLMSLQAAMPILAFLVDQWGPFEPSTLVRSTAAIAVPLLLAQNRWLRVGLIWLLLLVPMSVALVTTFIALILIWIPSLIGWIATNPKPLIALVILGALNYLFVSSPLWQGGLAVFALVVVLRIFRRVGVPPAIGPTRR
jgi:hypothetical protein